jgi:hypothetical protein
LFCHNWPGKAVVDAAAGVAGAGSLLPVNGRCLGRFYRLQLRKGLGS